MGRLKALMTIIFGLAVTLFFALAYPHHLHFQEQYQLFLFEAGYVREVLSVPGGLADLLGRFCTQFFLYARVGAIIIGVLLVVVQLMSARLVGWNQYYGLSFLPAALLWVFLLDENALLGGVWALILVMLAAWDIGRIANPMGRSLVALVCAPLLYWMAGPAAFLFVLLVFLDEARRGTFVSRCISVVTVGVLCVLPAVLPHFVSVSAARLWQGVHYTRYPDAFPMWLWLATGSVAVLSMLHLFVKRWHESEQRWVRPVVSALIALVVVALGVRVKMNPRTEQVMAYDYMARNQQWNRILQTADHQMPDNPLMVTALNLALGMKGLMADNMFRYVQNGVEGLLPEFVSDPVSPLTTSEAYYQLGMINTAQRFVFEAQEAIPDYQKSGRCYKRLAETNLIVGNYPVARKYLSALSHTLFYRTWANETMKLLSDDEQVRSHPEYGRLRSCIVEEDYFYSDRDLSAMLGRLFLANRRNRLAFEYLEASYLLSKDIDSFVARFPLSESIGYPRFPLAFQEGLLLWWSREHTAQEQMPPGIDRATFQRLNDFYTLTNRKAPLEQIEQRFGQTYWYYYFFVKNVKNYHTTPQDHHPSTS